MQVHHDEGVANRIDPESCADTREGIGEALTGERIGQPLSRESTLILPRCFIAAGSLIRGGCWLDENCIIGRAANLNLILVCLDEISTFQFVGDSVVGARVNLEAGSIVANFRNWSRQVWRTYRR